MPDLNDLEKCFLSIGIALAGDYAKSSGMGQENTQLVPVLQAQLVEKLGLGEEFGKACAETADVGEPIRAAIRKKRGT